jgi:hypothetical protein
LRPAYLAEGSPGDIVSTERFTDIFQRVKIEDRDFVVDNFKPGSSGEAELYNWLMKESGLLELFEG